MSTFKSAIAICGLSQKEAARAAANEKRRVEEEELKAAFLKTDEGKEWAEKSAFPTIDFSGGSETDVTGIFANCADLSGGKPWLK